ncbi:MAG TPA: cohesin domain-containing protein [Candidatus Polarisedimenticolaceae bacterium]|nr:cohesin domain-containing protein [Candidatus Polarisedimenticolaceae bacterium]
MIHQHNERTRCPDPTRLLPLLLVTSLVACGGGGETSGLSGGPGGGSGILAGNFTPDNPDPGANTVSIHGSSNTNIVTLNVTVTGVTDVFGASFDVTYDPTMTEFVNWSPGSLLESNNQQVSYQINSQQAGRLVVGVARTTPSGGANAGISTGLVKLLFRVTQAGASQVRFERAGLLNSADPPQSIGGIVFAGGTLTAN